MNNKTTTVFEKANNVRRHVNEFDKAFSINLNVPNDLNEPAQIIDFMTDTLFLFVFISLCIKGTEKVSSEISI